jgi:hypothetical protein
MKTITLNTYKFSELSEEAKEKAINKWREDECSYTPYYIEEANSSFEKFADLFSINWKNIDYEESWRNNYDLNFDDNVLNLTGQRLATYLWNNYKTDLFKGKYYSLWSKTDISYEHYKDGYPVLKKRRSNIFLDNCCVLTGVCYDDDLLSPIYEFLNKPKDINIETLLNDCIYSLCHSVSSEIEYQNSDEAITETIEANDYDFYDTGELA